MGLETVWKFRINGEVEKARRGWLAHRTHADDEKTSVHQELLRASFLRYDGAVDESDRLLARLDSRFPKLPGELETFLFRLQKGLNALVRARYPEALQSFLAAESVVPANPLFQYTAKCNVLWCLEYLGLPTENFIAEVALLEAEMGAEVCDASRDQFAAFRLRETFRENRTAKLQGLDPSKHTGQTRWTALWIQEVLTLRDRDDSARTALAEIRNAVLATLPEEEYQREFLLQTYLGSGGSLSHGRLKDLCDRFYLWTWRWLREPGSVSAFRLRALRNEIAGRAATESLGSEDFQQWRNASLWLALFEGKRWASVEAGVRAAQPFHRRADAYYESEFRMLEKIFLGKTPRTAERDEGFRALPSDVRRRIRERSRPRARSGISTVVDLETGQITNLRAKRKTSSERLLRLFLALYREPRIERERAMALAFGLKKIDRAIHGPIWDDLLARLRRFLPKGFRVATRGEWIVCEGEWSSIEVIGDDPIVFGAATAVPAASSVGRREKRLRELEAKVLSWFADHSTFTRVDMEASLGISRAAMNRLLVRMRAAGKLAREGRTKAAIYRLESSEDSAAGARFKSD
jgi:hypothetical protein